MFKKLIHKDNSQTTIKIRLMVGTLFLSEGIQKILFRGIQSTVRFEKIGLFSTQFLDYYSVAFEIICVRLIILGLFKRIACISLKIIIEMKFTPTKSEVYLKNDFGKLLHGRRTDLSMLFSNILLFIRRGGSWS